MIAHQAPGVDQDAEVRCTVRDQGQVEAAIGVREEDLAAVIPAMSEVVRSTYTDDTGMTGHSKG